MSVSLRVEIARSRTPGNIPRIILETGTQEGGSSEPNPSLIKISIVTLETPQHEATEMTAEVYLDSLLEGLEPFRLIAKRWRRTTEEGEDDAVQD